MVPGFTAESSLGGNRALPVLIRSINSRDAEVSMIPAQADDIVECLIKCYRGTQCERGLDTVSCISCMGKCERPRPYVSCSCSDPQWRTREDCVANWASWCCEYPDGTGACVQQ
jgi:hypothetical protein